MGSLWMPGAILVPSSHDGGSMLGGGAFVTWHTFEAPYSLSAKSAAQRLIAAGNEVSHTFNPITGDVAQLLPANRAGRGLRNPSGGVETNRRGTVHFQVEVCAYAKNPWTSDLTPAGKAGLARLMAYFRSHGVPDTWPSGSPPAYPYGRDERSTSAWAHPGHFGHSQAPENTHGDPGNISVTTLFGVLSPGARPPAKPSRGKARKPVLTRLLKRGSTGGAVRALQDRLRALGYTGVGKVDGVFGPKTEAAVKAFQRRSKHHLTADGIVGPRTANALGWAWK